MLFRITGETQVDVADCAPSRPEFDIPDIPRTTFVHFFSSPALLRARLLDCFEPPHQLPIGERGQGGRPLGASVGSVMGRNLAAERPAYEFGAL